MSPFEKSQTAAETFATQLYYSYVMLGYIPAMDDLEKQKLLAIMSGDASLTAALTQCQNTINKQIVTCAFEA